MADVLKKPGARLQRRCQAGQPYLSAGIFPGQIAYAWKSGETARAQSESVVELRGMVSNSYYSELTDEEVREILGELAQFMGSGLRHYVFAFDSLLQHNSSPTSSPGEAGLRFCPGQGLRFSPKSAFRDRN